MRGHRSLRSDRPTTMGIVTQVRVRLRRETLSYSLKMRSGTDPSRIRPAQVLSGIVGDRIGVVKLLRARGGCLGVIRDPGVEGCDKSGGAAQRASIPEC